MAHRRSQAGQAREPAQRTAANAQTNPVLVEPPGPRTTTFAVELLLDEDNNVQRTRVVHVEDQTEETWNGWVEPRLVNFFVRYAGLHRPLPEPLSPADTETLPGESPEMLRGEHVIPTKHKSALTGVLRVSELATTPLHSNAPQPLAGANQPFHTRVLLDLTEVHTSPARTLQCTATVWARNLGTGARQVVGQGRSTFKHSDHVPCAVDCTIRSPGTYRLEAVVTLAPASSAAVAGATLMAWLESGLLVVY